MCFVCRVMDRKQLDVPWPAAAAQRMVAIITGWLDRPGCYPGPGVRSGRVMDMCVRCLTGQVDVST